MSFPAQFAGHCPECGERIEIGDLLIRAPEDGYQHAVCPEATPEKPTKFQGTTLESMGF